MKIAFFAPRVHSNQVDLIKVLQAHGHQVAFIVMGQQQSEERICDELAVLQQSKLGAVVNRLFNPSNEFAKFAAIGIPNLRCLYRAIAHASPEVAIVRGLTPFYILLSVPYLLWRRVRIVVYTQGPRHRPRFRLRTRLAYYVAITVLRFPWFTPVLYRASDGMGPKGHPALTFIPFFKYASANAYERDYHLQEPRLLSVGKLLPRKNLLLMIEVIALLRAHCKFTYTWIGECSNEAQREYLEIAQRCVSKNGLQDTITIETNVPYRDMPSRYLAHDLFVMPSAREPASISQLEAMAFGLPVVCSSDNGTAHYIDHGESGFVVAADAGSIADAIRWYLDVPSRIRTHGARALELLKSRYDINTAYEQLLDLMADGTRYRQ